MSTQQDHTKEMTMNRDLGAWTYEDCALVLTDEVGVAEAEKLAAQGAH
jgi:hypothetical protein